MNILCLPSWYPHKYDEISGIFIKKHIKILGEENRVSVLYIHADTIKKDNELDLEVTSENNITEYKYYYKKSSFFSNIISSIKCLRRGYKRIIEEQGKPDISHLFVAYPAGISALYLKIFHKIGYVLTEHWSGYTKYDGRYFNYPFFTRFFIRNIFKHALKLSVISNFLGKSIIEARLTKKYLITPNVVELPADDDDMKTEGLHAISIASLDDFTKNISGMVDAVEMVVGEFPQFRLDIIGDGVDKEKLISYSAEKNLLNKNIFFIGTVPNKLIHSIYKKYDLFILNSNFETFSIATVEAIINGIPVVVTKCGGPEDFVNQSNGVLVERKNPIDLYKGIKHVIVNLQKFDKNAMREEIMKSYNSLAVKKALIDFYSKS